MSLNPSSEIGRSSTDAPTHSPPAMAALTPSPVSVGVARNFVARRLREMGLPHLVDNATIVASELVTNAVQAHQRDCPYDAITVAVGWTDGGRPRVSVRDYSSALPWRRNVHVLSERGWGLNLVEALSLRAGYDEAPDGGKWVWAEW